MLLSSLFFLSFLSFLSAWDPQQFFSDQQSAKNQCRFLAQFQRSPFDKDGNVRCKWKDKYDTDVVRSRIPCSRPLFITGTGYSGTHFAASAFNIYLNISASHEKSSARSTIDVSWFSRYDTDWLFGDTTAQPTYSDAGNFFRQGYDPQPSSRECLYETVLHQVRHPLKALASMLHHTDGSARVRENINPNRQVWAHIFGRTPIPTSAWYKDGILRSPLERVMLHYLTWNYLVEQAADFRYRVENFDTEKICNLSSLSPCRKVLAPESAEANIAIDLLAFSHSGDKRHITWEMLYNTNGQLAEHIWNMAKRYGYDRSPAPKSLKPVVALNMEGNLVEIKPETLKNLKAKATKMQRNAMMALLMSRSGHSNHENIRRRRYASALRIAKNVLQEYMDSKEEL